jgi:CelD/BcsL family acetyltransferase involved in cellulose biosynthesis
MRYLRFIGADPNITEVPGAVCLPEVEREAYTALLNDLQGSLDQWHWIRWSGLRPDGIPAQVIGSVWPMHWTRKVPAYLLTLESSWEGFHACLTRKMKKSLRNCYHTLARDGHEFVFVATALGEEIPDALGHFLRLHEARARISGGVHHPNVFASDEARQFLMDVCQDLASRGELRVFTLRIRDQIVAARIGFVFGGTLYLYYSGYDPAWAKYSVMTALVGESIKYAIASGLRTVNLSTGTDASKTRWRPTEVRYHEAVQISPSLGAHATYAAYWSAIQLQGHGALGELVGRLFKHR